MGWTELAAAHEEITITKTGDLVTSVVIAALVGTEETPIALDAAWDEIDGGGTKTPLTITNCQWLTISNVLAHSSDDNCIWQSGGGNLTFNTCLAWDAEATDNYKPWQFYDADNITLNDCAGWGYGRKIFAAQQNDDCEYNRCYGQWGYPSGEGSTAAGNKFAFGIAYNSYRGVCNDCIAYLPTTAPAGTTGGNPWGWGPDHTDGDPAECVVNRSVVIAPWGSNAFLPGTPVAITFTDCNDATVANQYYVNRKQIWALRTVWQSSPILAKLLQYADVDVLGQLDALLRVTQQWKQGSVPRRSTQVLLMGGSGLPYGKPDTWLDLSRKLGTGVVADVTAEGRDAELSVSDAFETSSGIQFDGVDDYALVASGDEITANAEGVGTTITFVARFMLRQAPASGVAALICESAAAAETSDRSMIGITPSGKPYIRIGATEVSITAGSSLADGAVHTIVGWYLSGGATPTNGRVRLRLDGGTSNLSNLQKTEHVSAADTTTIGAEIAGSQPRSFFAGVIYECGRFPSVLSDAAIAAFHAGTWPTATCKGRWTMTPAAVADAGTAGLWRSRVGNNAFTQVTAASRPTLDADGADPHPSLVFSTDLLKQPHAAAISTSGHVLAVVKAAAGAEQVVYSQSDEATAVKYAHLGVSAAGNIWYAADNDGTELELTGNTALGTDWHLLEWISSGTAVSMYVDGVVQTLTVAGGTNDGRWFGDISGVDNAIVGAAQADDAAFGHLDGQIAELIVLDSAQSIARGANVRAKLKAKYGL